MKGHSVHINWLCFKASNIQRQQKGNREKVKKHATVNFIGRPCLKDCRVKRKERKQRKFREKYHKWYTKLRERFIFIENSNDCHDEK